MREAPLRIFDLLYVASLSHLSCLKSCRLKLLANFIRRRLCASRPVKGVPEAVPRPGSVVVIRVLSIRHRTLKYNFQALHMLPIKAYVEPLACVAIFVDLWRANRRLFTVGQVPVIILVKAVIRVRTYVTLTRGPAIWFDSRSPLQPALVPRPVSRVPWRG